MTIIRIGEAVTGLGLEENALEITAEFLHTLKTTPPVILTDQGAYVFTSGGEIEDADFRYECHHGVDCRQTCLIEDRIMASTKDHPQWDEIYPEYNWVWNDRVALANVQQKINPNILFVGETSWDGIDVFVRRNAVNEITGILLQPGFLEMQGYL